MADFVEQFCELTEGTFSPRTFCKWTGIFTVASALERRVWIKSGRYNTFANLYLFLVAPPGVGKQVIDEAKELVREVKDGIKVAPDSMTRASLVDDLSKLKTTFLPPQGPPYEYHSMSIFAEEAGVMLPAYDGSFLSLLTKLYNNPKDEIETRRHGPAKEVIIHNPQINMVVGVQPGWLAETLPESAWTTGWTSRIIMVYASESPFRELFEDDPAPAGVKSSLIHKLRSLSKLYGEAGIDDDAKGFLQDWHRGGGQPKPTHSKLEHYCRRRTSLHVTKLALIAAASRWPDGIGVGSIQLEDAQKAVRWLTEAEATMPDIFRAMVGRSDAQITEELHGFLVGLWNNAGKKPIHEEKLIRFLHQRVPSDKVEKILQMAERGGIIARMAGEATYVPRPKNECDVE